LNHDPSQSLSQVYLVGGAVRDRFLGKESKDLDYVVVGENVATMKKLGFMPVGKDFPVFLHPTTKHEYALARTERKTGAGYTGFSVDASETVSLEDDLARRDLTINAMAMDKQNKLIDPFNGKQDIDNKILKHTTEAFSEDPVRVLRIARFYARFGSDWTIHASTKALVKEMKASGELTALVPERVWKETEKALMEKTPQLYFEALDDMGVLSDLFPEIAEMKDVPQSPEHHPEGDVFKHTMLVVKRAADLGADVATRFAALTHDFGKAPNFAKHGNLYGHESAGVPIIEAFCERLRIPNKLKELGKLTSEHHLKCHRLREMTPKKVHQLIVTDLNALKQPERFEQFLLACQCDAQGRGPLFVDKPYASKQYAEYLLTGLQALDAKKVIQDAISSGKSGMQLGDTLRIAQIDCVKKLMGNWNRTK
jgi:tRNA nucleotidyltransferase (CCA-adding enzyme)